MDQIFKGRTAFITGSTRGIGLAIGQKLASHGANVVVTGKTSEPHPKLENTVWSAVAQIESCGGKALGIVMDIRNEEAIFKAVEQAVEHFGGIDILVNNASAISLEDTENLSVKRYDLMHQINVRGTFLASKFCIPHLAKSDHAHILTMSPPLEMDLRWWGQHLGYTLSKYSMSLIGRGLALELHERGIGSNCLWPKTIIATAAIRNLLGGEAMLRSCRKPDIVADAAFYILRRPPSECTGRFFIDEEVLRSEGIEDFDKYSESLGGELFPDIFL